jgi:PhnB protein
MPQCKGITKNGLRCQKEGNQGNYCWQHERVSNTQLKQFGGGLWDDQNDPIVRSVTCTCDCQGDINQDELMEAMKTSGVLGSSPMQFGTSSKASDSLSVAPNLSFDGHCEEAFKFYEKVFGGRITTMMKYSDLPKKGHRRTQDVFSKDFQDKIAHASISIGNTELMGSDLAPNQYLAPVGFEVIVNIADQKKAERIFKTLSSGGKITMPLERTSWSRFGIVTDKYGVPWMINSGSRSF